MMAEVPSRLRIRALLAALAVQTLLAWALVSGLEVPLPIEVRRALALIHVAPSTPPSEPQRQVQQPTQRPRPPGRPSIVMAPLPSPPITAMPIDIVLTESDSEAAGAAGEGQGDGAGGAGAGAGASGGAGSEIAAPPRLLSGRITPADFPRDAATASVDAALSTESLVGIDGRVSECRVTVSSGSRVLDETTCALMIERYRYAPARDTLGRPVPDTVPRDHLWSIRR